jgi:hypothetical protein
MPPSIYQYRPDWNNVMKCVRLAMALQQGFIGFGVNIREEKN